MPSSLVRSVRQFLPAVYVLIVIGALFLIARPPDASASDRAALAGRFHFSAREIALPPDLPKRSVRQVNPRYENIRSWISSVGAAIAINDLEDKGVADVICLVDTRSDAVIVTPVPGSASRVVPFVLNPAPLPMNDYMAPMGCVPGDFNGDGRTDLLVYYWGRTPIVFLRTAKASALSAAAYLPAELVWQGRAGEKTYSGPLWNSNAVAVADFDGDGHPDIAVFNYFPNSGVLNPNGIPDTTMNHSLSRAENGGGAHILRWVSANASSVEYEEQDAVPFDDSTGWTLAASSADLDGDLLPELYIANDFGHDHLLYNVSERGKIEFKSVLGRRGALTPKSMVLGQDSFKGMGAEFGDLSGEGRFDIFVSNITSSWGLEESNFVWHNTSTSSEDARLKMNDGVAPFENVAMRLNMAWTGWGWDAKMADFDNSGQLSVVQTAGFVKGEVNRWPWLQELAISNDLMLANPAMWPNQQPGDDISGSEGLAFWVRERSGRFVNVSHELGLDIPIPTRGIAVADTDGKGWQSFAVARQWGPPMFYHNDGAEFETGSFLGLHLYRPAPGGARTPAYGAEVVVRTADGRSRIAQLDGGGGHSGKRSFDVLFGLGAAGDRLVSATVSWRDNGGKPHVETLNLGPGWHSLMLTSNAKEVSPR